MALSGRQSSPSGGSLKGASSLRGAILAAAALSLLSACGQQTATAPSPDAPPAAGQIAPNSIRTDAQMDSDRNALVAAMGALAPPEAAMQFATDFEAASEEPPWELSLTNEYVSFRRANLEPIEGRPRKREVRENGLLVETDDLVVTIRVGACTFESGGSFAFSATVFWNGASFSGCARPASGAAGAGTGWAVIVPRILPAVDACLRRADAKPARITIAYPMENGTDIGIRLLEADNGRGECVAGADGVVRTYEGLSDRDVFRGERDPLFTRAPTKPPTGRCDDNTELRDAAGNALGWLTRQKC